MLVASPTEAKTCMECGLRYGRMEAKVWGNVACICASCHNILKEENTALRLRLYAECGVRKDASTYTQAYIKKLPTQFRKEAKQLYRAYLDRRKERNKLSLRGVGS